MAVSAAQQLLTFLLQQQSYQDNIAALQPAIANFAGSTLTINADASVTVKVVQTPPVQTQPVLPVLPGV